MIRLNDLQEAIAECEGQRNPNANTCIKLASFYTLRDHLMEKAKVPVGNLPMVMDYSYSAEPKTESGVVDYESDSEFGRLVSGMNTSDVMEIMDELMSTLQVMIPRLYAGVLAKLEK